MSNVLIACEQFGVIRDAFIFRGHNAVSCDLMPTRVPGPHYEGDVRDILSPWYWDLIIAHPDCTYLTVSAAWALCDPDYNSYPGVGYHQKISAGTLVGAERRQAQKEALDFVELLGAVKCHWIAIENPAIGAINKNVNLIQYGFRSNFPTQVIQPHQFGHDASKSTGLALKGLPDLVPTCHIEPRIVNGKPRWGNQTDSGQNTLSPGDDRAMQRAKTYQGWADAMADQWGVTVMTTRVTFMGVSVSPRNARIAEMMMSGSTFAEVASELGIDENRVRTYVIRLRQRGIPIPRQKRFKLVATSDSGERFEFVGKADVEQRGGYGYRQAHKAAQRGCEYLGLKWSKEPL